MDELTTPQWAARSIPPASFLVLLCIPTTIVIALAGSVLWATFEIAIKVRKRQQQHKFA